MRHRFFNGGRHETLGIEYLLSRGYNIKDIYITGRTPDIITTNDNQGWEIKFVSSGTLYFTVSQLYMTDDTNILVFKYDQLYSQFREPIVIAKFIDILSGRYYKYNVKTK